MASRNHVVGGKKLAIALGALQHKITAGGVLRVGFLENAKYPETTNKRFLDAVGSSATPSVVPAMPIAQAAFWNEYGTRTAPARPFFRTTIRTETDRWAALLASSIVAHNYDGVAALRELGQVMRDDVENTIAQWAAPPNAPLTVKIKGFNKPLIDQGLMQRAVDYELTK